ncbi:hypothetical protein O181_008322 [Austropuccinia psidii MF-1]|uniref:Uncharacterized protein n=1 Tax=Austropuccinia psidii MF-1 TaxID=1389203 RepID=A0A9Q3BNK4_9BASI|nr:hypothetical protein [Austropuccinia psidii MF-1]
MGPRGEFQQPQGLVGPPEPDFGQKVKRPKLTKNSKILKSAQGPKTPKLAQGLKTQSLAPENHRTPPDSLNQGFSLQYQGILWPTQMDPSLQESGVVYIWYYIPLCPIFPQKLNGDVFMTSLCHFKSSHQSNYPVQRKALAPQSYMLWQ